MGTTVSTRERLVEAAIRLLGDEGPDAVTTTRLAAEVGIVQSGFYSHFGRVDDIVELAAERIGAGIQALLVDHMAALRAEDPGDVEALTRLYIQSLGKLDQERGFVELFTRHRRDPTPIGRVLAEIGRQLRTQVADHLELIDVQLPDRRDVEFVAELLMWDLLTAAGARSDDLAPDVEFVAQVLARQTVGAVVHAEQAAALRAEAP